MVAKWVCLVLAALLALSGCGPGQPASTPGAVSGQSVEKVDTAVPTLEAPVASTMPAHSVTPAASATRAAPATQRPSMTPTPAPSATAAASATQEPTASAMPSATPSPTPQEGLEESAYPTPGIPLTATTSYTDTVVGYVVDYPADWYIQGQPGGVAVLTSYDVGQVSGHGGIISGTAKMDIVPQALSSGQTLEDLVAGGTSEAQRVQSLEQVRLRSGLRAVRLEYDVEQVQNLHVLITMINGYSVRIYSYGDQRFFDAIAGSLRPTR